MDTVADHLGGDGLVLGSSSDDAGLPVMDGRHGIVEVGQMGHAGVNGSLGVLVVGIGVGDGDGAKLFRLLHKFHRARKLRRQVHDGDQSLAVLVQLPEGLEVRQTEIFSVLGALFLLGEEGSLHLHAQKSGSSLHGLLMQAQPGGESLRNHIIGQCHGGGREARHTHGGQVAGHLQIALIGTVGKIGIGIAVVVHVDEAGDHVSTRQVHRVLFFCQNVTEFPVFHGKPALNEPEILGINISVFEVHNNLQKSQS